MTPCPIDGTLFEPTTARNLYCSDACAHEADLRSHRKMAQGPIDKLIEELRKEGP